MSRSRNTASGSAIGLFVGVPVHVVSLSVCCTAIALFRLFSAIKESYKALWRIETLGPVIKTLMGALGPILVVLAPFVVFFGAIIFGLFSGFAAVMNDFEEVFSSASEYIRDFDREGIVRVLTSLSDYNPRLKEGERPFDIRIPEGLSALFAGVTAGVIAAIGILLVCVAHWPRVILKALANFADPDEETFGGYAVNGAWTLILILVYTVGVVFAPITSLSFGLGYMCMIGYREGVRAAFSKISEIISETNDFINKYVISTVLHG